jgi:type III secretion protein J
LSIVIRAWLRASVVLLSVLLTGCRVDLFTQIPETEANEVLDALYAAGLTATKVTAGDRLFTVQVPESQMGEALRVTQERGVPRPRHLDLCKLFKKEGLMSTASEERVRFICGVSQQLDAALTQIPGVLYASVMPVMPANDPLADKVRPASASVMVKHDPHVNVEAHRPAIKDMVARSIEGLHQDNITITLIAADAPQRTARAEPMVPRWLVASLSILALAACLAVAAAGAVLWHHRRSIAAPSDAAGAADPMIWFGTLLSRLPLPAWARRGRDADGSAQASSGTKPRVGSLEVVSARRDPAQGPSKG